MRRRPHRAQGLARREGRRAAPSPASGKPPESPYPPSNQPFRACDGTAFAADLVAAADEKLWADPATGSALAGQAWRGLCCVSGAAHRVCGESSAPPGECSSSCGSAPSSWRLASRGSDDGGLALGNISFKVRIGPGANPRSKCASDGSAERPGTLLGVSNPSASPAAASDVPRADPDLSAVVAAWPELPPAIRTGFIAMVSTTTRLNLGGD